jgi:Domain of unknown function (DUF4382)
MKNLTLSALLFLFVVSISCKKDNVEEAEVSVYLQDAPAISYDKIKIELKGVSIYSQTAGSWVSLNVTNGVFDLLTLNSSNQAFLGKIKLVGGNISQLQLIIGNQNTVTVGGINYPLVLDSTDLDKLKVKIDNNINGGSFYKLTIDFKAQESIDNSGNVYKLKASLKITVKEI